MNTIHKDADTLEHALNAFQRETGLQFVIHERQITTQNRRIDAVIGLPEPGQARFPVEVKRWAQHANFGAIIHQVQQLPGQGILVADHVNRKMARRLKDLDVQFIDAAGNAFINCPPIYVYVCGNAPRATLTDARRDAHQVADTGTGRAFTPTGLKVVYALLCNPGLAGAPYRQIAEEADVALGTVGWVINDLKMARKLVARGKHKKLTNYRDLLTRWAEEYPVKLRPKQLLGVFTHDDPHWWTEFNPQEMHALWGGEVAAAKMTGYLKPATVTIYLRGEIGQLVRRARLRKVNGPVIGTTEVFRTFWPQGDTNDPYVHPALVYADLLATADPRNLETAEIIYERHLAEFDRQT